MLDVSGSVSKVNEPVLEVKSQDNFTNIQHLIPILPTHKTLRHSSYRAFLH
jgi:hypothetical protein